MEPMRPASCAGWRKRLNNRSCCRCKDDPLGVRRRCIANSSTMSESANIDLAVIGAGPGGYAAAYLAADLGMKVTLIDPEVNPGGVCLYRGCIPSKALLHVAKVMDEARHASAWGATFTESKADVDQRGAPR